MDTGLTDGGLGFGLPASGTGGQFQSPFTLPGSPDQKLLQQTIPPVLQPQHQTAGLRFSRRQRSQRHLSSTGMTLVCDGRKRLTSMIGDLGREAAG